MMFRKILSVITLTLCFVLIINEYSYGIIVDFFKDDFISLPKSNILEESDVPVDALLDGATLNLSSSMEAYPIDLNIREGDVRVPSQIENLDFEIKSLSPGDEMIVKDDEGLIYVLPKVERANTVEDLKRIMEENDGDSGLFVNVPGFGLCEVIEFTNSFDVTIGEEWALVDDMFDVNSAEFKENNFWGYLWYSIARFIIGAFTWPWLAGHQSVYLKPLNAPEYSDAPFVRLTEATFEDKVLGQDNRVYRLFSEDTNILEVKGNEGVQIKPLKKNPFLHIYKIEPSDEDEVEAKVSIKSDIPSYVGHYSGPHFYKKPTDAGTLDRRDRVILPGAYGMGMSKIESGDNAGLWQITDDKTGNSIMFNGDSLVLDDTQLENPTGYIAEYNFQDEKYVLAFDTDGILSGIYPYTGEDNIISEDFYFSGKNVNFEIKSNTGLNPDIVFNAVNFLKNQLPKEFYFLLDGVDTIKVRINPSDEPDATQFHGKGFAFSNDELILSSKFIENSQTMLVAEVNPPLFSRQELTEKFFHYLRSRYFTLNVEYGIEGDDVIVNTLPFVRVLEGDNIAMINAELHKFAGDAGLFARKVEKLEGMWRYLLDNIYTGGNIEGVVTNGIVEGTLVMDGSITYKWQDLQGTGDSQGPNHGFLSPQGIGAMGKGHPDRIDVLTAIDIGDYMYALKNKGLEYIGQILDFKDGNYDYLHQGEEGYNVDYLIKLMMVGSIDISLTGKKDAESLINWIEQKIAGDDGIDTQEAQVFVDTIERIRDIEAGIYRSLYEDFDIFKEFLDRYMGLYDLKKDRRFPNDYDHIGEDFRFSHEFGDYPQDRVLPGFSTFFDVLKDYDFLAEPPTVNPTLHSSVYEMGFTEIVNGEENSHYFTFYTSGTDPEQLIHVIQPHLREHVSGGLFIDRYYDVKIDKDEGIMRVRCKDVLMLDGYDWAYEAVYKVSEWEEIRQILNPRNPTDADDTLSMWIPKSGSYELIGYEFFPTD